MKRIVIACVLLALCAAVSVGCTSSDGFTGTYKLENEVMVCTLIVRSNGTFRFERKFLYSSGLDDDPVDNDKENIREGTYTITKDEKGTSDIINLKYTYTDPLGMTHKFSATGISVRRDGKVYLTVAGPDISGTFVKK